MSVETPENHDKLRTFVQRVDGSVRKYSGRGMYGAECLAIVSEHDRTDVVMLAGELMLPIPVIDSMGRRFVYYWPALSWDWWQRSEGHA